MVREAKADRTVNQRPRKRKQPVGASPYSKQKTRYVWLNVLPDDLWLKVRDGETVWEALRSQDVELESDCGGLGKCGKCKIRVFSSIGPPSKEEEGLLDEEELEQGVRLACRTQVDKDLVIQAGDAGATEQYFQVLKTGHRPFLHPDPLITKRLITLPPDQTCAAFGALDLCRLIWRMRGFPTWTASSW